MNDQAIVNAVLKDENKQVFKELYKTVFPSILKHVKSNSGSRFDSEDCFQESLLELIASIRKGRYDNQYSIKNYMIGIGKNKWSHELRRRKRFSDQEEQNEMIDDKSLVFEKERETIIKELFSSLGERCEELLNMVIYDNMRHKEIMLALDISSEDVVKTNYYRCKEKLRKKTKHSKLFYRLLRGE